MLVGYSGSGLRAGWPTFPGTAGCVVEPVAGSNVRAVVGYADSYPEAIAMQKRARMRDSLLPKPARTAVGVFGSTRTM